MEAEHLCMSMRGVRKGHSTVTSSVTGICQRATRAEAMRFLGQTDLLCRG